MTQLPGYPGHQEDGVTQLTSYMGHQEDWKTQLLAIQDIGKTG